MTRDEMRFQLIVSLVSGGAHRSPTKGTADTVADTAIAIADAILDRLDGPRLSLNEEVAKAIDDELRARGVAA